MLISGSVPTFEMSSLQTHGDAGIPKKRRLRGRRFWDDHGYNTNSLSNFVSAMLVVAYLNTVTSSFCWPSWCHDLMQTCLSFYLIDRFWEELRSLILSWLCEDMYIVYIIPAYALYCYQSTLTIWSTKESQIKAVFTSERYRLSRAMQFRRCVSAEWASWDICCRNHRSIQTLHKSAKQLQTVEPEHRSRIAISIVQTSKFPIWK